MHHALAAVRGFRRASGRVRFQQYTRAALYFFFVAEAASFGAWAVAAPSQAPVWARLAIVLVGGGHVWLMCLLTRDGLRFYLHEGPRPDRLLTAGFLVTLGGTAMTVLLLAGGAAAPDAAIVLSWFPAFFVGPVLLVLPIPRGSALAAVPVAVVAVAAPLLDVPPDTPVPLVLSTAAMAAFFGATFRSSAWTLRVVEELDAARETQARLAVAEERLRFGRDMHDVLGRNLSVIALKSELAVQLAQRGSAAALDQMAEVQRIARESQQEMRAVLRGYREADLHAEIAGARGVLEAAGINCQIAARPAERLPSAVRTPLGWVVREAATNVLRHSDARHCALRVELDGDGAALLTVANDGVPDGSSGPAAGRPGTGLAGLRERLATVGGTLTAGPAGPGRYLLTARVPVGPVGPDGPDGPDGERADGRRADGERTDGRDA